jgi:soluble lytic murein transglycosylase-like protein
MPGESLYSIAAADGLSVAQLAAANGLSVTSSLPQGANITIPPQGAAPVAPVAAGGPVADGDGDSDGDGGAAAPAPVGVASTPSAGSYVVQPGDTLSAIAARAGTTVTALAAANGLNPIGVLPAGAVLTLSGAGAQQPVGAAAVGNSSAGPFPTPERLSAPEIGQIGASNGSPSSLTDAIAWQESGFNNDVVSPAGAVGIMQIMPGTWQWIQHSLDPGAPLSPSSAADNVRGGSMMLHWLLNQTGGDPTMAAAGYYQGLSSVQRYGVFPSTQRYLNNVMSLNSQFGGG